MRVVRLVGEGVGESAPNDCLALGRGRAEVGVTRAQNGELRVGAQHEKEPGKTLEQKLEIEAGGDRVAVPGSGRARRALDPGA